jgi:hypothetical protein
LPGKETFFDTLNPFKDRGYGTRRGNDEIRSGENIGNGIKWARMTPISEHGIT